MPRENREYYINEKTKQQIIELQNIAKGEFSLSTNDYNRNMFSVLLNDKGVAKEELDGNLINAVVQRNNIIAHTQQLLDAFEHAADPNFDQSKLPDFQGVMEILDSNINGMANSLEEWNKGGIGEDAIGRAGKQLAVMAKLAGIQNEMLHEQNRELDYQAEKKSQEELGEFVQKGLDAEHAEIDQKMRRGMDNFYDAYSELGLKGYPMASTLTDTKDKTEVQLHKDLKTFGDELDRNLKEANEMQQLNLRREREIATRLSGKKEALQKQQEELKKLETEGRDLEGHIMDQSYYLEKGYIPKDAESRAMFRAVDSFMKQHEELHKTISDEFNAYLESTEKQRSVEIDLEADRDSLEIKRNIRKKFEEQMNELDRQIDEVSTKSEKLTKDLQDALQKYAEEETRKNNEKLAKNKKVEHQFGEHTKSVDRMTELQKELTTVNSRKEDLLLYREGLAQDLTNAWEAVKEAEERYNKAQAERDVLNKSNLEAQQALQEKAQMFGNGYYGIVEDIYKVEALTEEYKKNLQKDIEDSKKALERNQKAIANKKSDIRRAESDVEWNEQQLTEATRASNENRHNIMIMEGRAKTDLNARIETLEKRTEQKHDLERQKIEEQAANERKLLDLQKKDAENQKKVADMTKAELIRLSDNIINAKKWGLAGDTTEYANLKTAATAMRDHMLGDDVNRYMQNPQFKEDLQQLKEYSEAYTQAKLAQHKDGTDRRKNRIDAARDMGDFAAAMKEKDAWYFAEPQVVDYEKKLAEIEKKKTDELKKLDERIKAEKDEIQKIHKPAEKEVKKVSLDSIMEEEKQEEAAPKTAQTIPYAMETLSRQRQQLSDFHKQLSDEHAIFNNLEKPEYKLYKNGKLQVKGKEAEFAEKLKEKREALERETTGAIEELDKISRLNPMQIIEPERWEAYHAHLDEIQKLHNDMFKMKVPQADMKNKALRGAATSLFNGVNSYANGMAYVEMIDQNIMKIESMPEFGQVLHAREKLAEIDDYRAKYTKKLHDKGIDADTMAVRNDPEGVQKQIADKMKVKPWEREAFYKMRSEQEKALEQFEQDLAKAEGNVKNAWFFNKSKRLKEKSMAESTVEMMKKELKETGDQIKAFESDERDSELNRLYKEIPERADAFRQNPLCSDEYRKEQLDNLQKLQPALQKKADKLSDKMAYKANQRASALGAMDKLVNGLNEEEKRGNKSKDLLNKVKDLRDELSEKVGKDAYDKADPETRQRMDNDIHAQMHKVRELAKDYIDNDQYAVNNANKRALCEAFLYDVEDVKKLGQAEKLMKEELKKNDKSEVVMKPDCLRLKKQADELRAAEERRMQRDRLKGKDQSKNRKAMERQRSGSELA